MKTIEFNNCTYYIVPVEEILCADCCFKGVCTPKKNFPIPKNIDGSFICVNERAIFKKTLIDAITHRLTE